MKIVLPRTLLEPGTIPWPTILSNDNELAMKIVKALHHFFRSAERANQIPTDDWEAWGKSQFSVNELADMLSMIAIEEGAEIAKVIEIGSRYGDKFQGERIGKTAWKISGFSFRITFSVPCSSKTYLTDIDFWFDSRPTLYG